MPLRYRCPAPNAVVGLTVVLACGYAGLSEPRTASAVINSINSDIVIASERGGGFDLFKTRVGPKHVDVLSGPGVNVPLVLSPFQTLVGAAADDSEPAWVQSFSEGGDFRLAFQSDRGGNYDLYTADREGNGLRQLTNGAASDLSPAWSTTEDNGDTATIAFVRDNGRGGDIWTMNAGDGSNQVKRTNHPGNDVTPTWEPRLGSSRIAFASDRRGSFDLFVMSSAGTELRRLTQGPADDLDPSWYVFDDGSERIVFSRVSGGQGEIYTVDPQSGHAQRLTSSLGDDIDPTWSPDGALILFASNRDGNYEIYVMNIDGSGQTRLTQSAGDDLDPDMLADPGSNVASTIVVDLGPGSPATTRRCTRGGTQGKDTLKGSRRGDVLCGFGGNDRLRGLGGRDFIDGGTGRDVISGGPGKDYIDARDGLRDRIRPGSGVDTVRYDARLDRVKGRIERPLY